MKILIKIVVMAGKVLYGILVEKINNFEFWERKI